MGKKTTAFLLTIILLLVGAAWVQGDKNGDLTSQWEEKARAFEEKWKKMKGAQEAKWEELEQRKEQTWKEMEAKVLRKWQNFVHSTQKDWVAYSSGLDTRSRVDFKEGAIVVETLVPLSDPDPRKTAAENIAKQIRMLVEDRDMGSEKTLQDQVVTKGGEPVGTENLDVFLSEEVLPKVRPAAQETAPSEPVAKVGPVHGVEAKPTPEPAREPEPVKSRDGVERQTYQVRIQLVPKHLRIRAEKYLPVVKKNAERFDLKPQLILAVIHTESYFNPRAVSSCSAIGMMQIIPRFAGKDAYGLLYPGDDVPTVDYLYEPENNIELGSAYLHLLCYRYFRDIQGEGKNRYVAVCGYNWGPTAMRSKVVSRHPLNEMEEEAVFALLQEETPAETRDYLQKVRERMPLYDPFFQK